MPSPYPVLPIFYSQSSFRSLFTFDTGKNVEKDGPPSVINVCLAAGIKDVFHVSTSFYDFMQAWKACSDNGLHYHFGLEILMCADTSIHDDASRKTEHKIIIFAKNQRGQDQLKRIFSAWRTCVDNKYYVYRFDWKKLKPLWTDDLMLVYPFFDSAIGRNTMVYDANIVPEPPVKPVLFKEIHSDIPFAGEIERSIDLFNSDNSHEVVHVKTIYYETKADFLAYNTLRAIHNGTTFNRPGIDWFCSDTFSFEEWRNLVEGVSAGATNVKTGGVTA